MTDMLKALADPNRLKIVKFLSDKPKCVCEIEEALGLPQNLVSHHLSALKEANIVENCRCGKKQFYSLNKKVLNEFSTKINKLGE